MAKEFPKNVFVKKSKFGIKVSFKVDDFIAELQSKKDASGWARIDLNHKKANPEEMYAAWDDWKPDPNYKGKAGGTPVTKTYLPQPPINSGVADDLPF